MNILRLSFILLLSINIFANEVYIDSITLSKIKKMVQKEEEIAYAYKKYIIEKGNTATLTKLIDDGYLPSGFSVINPFGKTTTIDVDKNKIESFIPDNMNLKSNLYDYYYSNANRLYTKAPLSNKNNNVSIVLSSKESFFLDNKNLITTTKTDALNKYYLDSKGVLHWYDNTGKYKFSFDKDLLIDENITIFNADGTLTSDFESLMADKNVMYAGQTIFHKSGNVALEYLNLGSNKGIIKVGLLNRDIGETIIQFTRRAGGMIVNGDIYTWGNNANKITGIDIDNYTKEDGTLGTRYPVITGLVRAKAKIYDNDLTDSKDLTKIYDKDYFSSPFRPKFKDFFSTVFAGTCGISTKGELYCGGISGIEYSFGTSFNHVDTSRKGEMLYRSTYFNGSNSQPKASKVFSNNQIWLILSEDGDIYRWGYDFSGFSGNGNRYFNYYYRNENKTPEKITVSNGSTSVKFADITYLLTIGYRKMGALSKDGDIYIWGVEPLNSNDYNCTGTWNNLCYPTQITQTNSTLTENVTFTSIQGGLEAFLAAADNGKYYKIYQPTNSKIIVQDVETLIKASPDYNVNNDVEILSIDFSSKLDGSLKINEGIVWVNGNNELKGDYFTAENKEDNLFKDAIKKIKWKKIKVIQDDNAMCGIDIYNQMYCWGIMSFYRSGTSNYDDMGNTYMIPVFNTNLYDLDKDYLVSEGAANNFLTNMTSDDWSATNSDNISGAFFIKYPTYIGGFNYEFKFK